MSVITNTNLLQIAAGFELPTDSHWIEMLRRGVLRRQGARVRWGFVPSLEAVTKRVLAGDIRNANETIVNEAVRVAARISKIRSELGFKLRRRSDILVDLSAAAPASEQKSA